MGNTNAERHSLFWTHRTTHHINIALAEKLVDRPASLARAKPGVRPRVIIAKPFP
ncbi:MAG: hypothetical protein LBI02_10310 [Opitutaceae bacterium]|nr:hypothetical protein [Opitutaceae bacterium]